MNTIEEICAWMDAQYPDSTNETCGLHVHVAMDKLNYSRLMEESFHEFFHQQMDDFWSKNKNKPMFNLFRERLDGKNRYCYKIFRPESQLFLERRYGEERYSDLNFCYGRHGTLECRVFPCFPDREDGKNAVKAFIDCCNLYLSRCKAEQPVCKTVSTKQLSVSNQPTNSKRKRYVPNHSLNW